MTPDWEHNPPESLTSEPWVMRLEADGALYVVCGRDTVHVLRVPSELVLELGNAIRRGEVRRVLEVQAKGKPK